jgi:hypothetical protein
MHATAVLPKTSADSAAVSLPIPLRRPTATLTPRGHAVLALIREQDALDIADIAGRDRLDREINELLVDVD